jgi:hypothetical protein
LPRPSDGHPRKQLVLVAMIFAVAMIGEHAGARAREIFDAVQLDFAYASRVVFYVMAGALAVAFVVALIAMPKGRVEEVREQPSGPAAPPQS